MHLYIDFLQIIHDSYNVELKVIIATKATNFPIKRQGKDFRDVGRFKNKGGGSNVMGISVLLIETGLTAQSPPPGGYSNIGSKI